ncbi:hypothetical protein [Nocardia nova]|uniref:hypothetical protein n=1 Tax=Nocardia nova TaxID=37330 RepID=UPI0011B0029D|nr:hypothetical protein [Nocardia nova]
MDTDQWFGLAKAVGGSLLGVAVAALSAPVTFNRLRLWQLERLVNVIDKLPTDDPASPYLQAERRKRAAWWAAAKASQMSPESRGELIFELWLVVVAVLSIIWPADALIPLWAVVVIGVFAGLRVLMTFRRMRIDRVQFYNTLIDSGPDEFAMMLRKRAGVPRLFGTYSEDEKLERLSTRATSHELERAKVRTCPNGHPVTGGSLFVSDYDPERDPSRSLLCGRCLAPLPAPLTRDIDEIESRYHAVREHERAKAEKKATAEKEKTRAGVHDMVLRLIPRRRS